MSVGMRPTMETLGGAGRGDSEILQLYNLFCNTQHHHMPILSEQLLVITSTSEPM